MVFVAGGSLGEGAPRSPWPIAFLTVTWLFLEVEVRRVEELKGEFEKP